MPDFVREYQEYLNQTYRKYGILSLQDDDVHFDGRNSVQFIYEHCSSLRDQHVDKDLLDALIQDLVNSTSVDVKIALGNVYLYRDLGLYDFASARINTGSYTAFRYHPTFKDRRFFFYVNACWEKLYNYWDRIGDLLWLCFQLPIDERSVFLSTVIKELEKRCSGSTHFQALKQSFSNEYQLILNKSRVQVVHYRQGDTDFFWQWLVNATNEAQIRALQDRRDALPEILRRQSQVAIEGFGHAGRLIGEFHGAAPITPDERAV